jgi:hypothetical protein
MNTKKEISISSIAFPVASYRIRDLAWTIAFVFAAVVSPALLAHTPQNQWITGTIVNAILFLAVWRVGAVNAAFCAALPSSIALMRGLLPASIAVFVPHIILSNLIMISIFYAAKKRPLLGVLAASLAKFAFLFGITFLFSAKLAEPFIFMLQWPQLATALAGGLIAIGSVRITTFFKKSALPE